MPFTYDQLEDEVVAYLVPLITDADIEAMPEKQAQYLRSVSKPRITIVYGGSEFQLPQSTNQVSHVEMVNLLCSVRAMSLRGAQGIYTTLQQLKKHLLGWKGTNTDRLFLKSIDLEDRNEQTNEWFYTVLFQAKKLQVQELETTEFDGVLLQQVIFNDKIETPDA